MSSHKVLNPTELLTSIGKPSHDGRWTSAVPSPMSSQPVLESGRSYLSVTVIRHDYQSRVLLAFGVVSW